MMDVVVVGASPAGLVAAKECAKKDVDVKILEKRQSFEDYRLPDTSFYGFFDFLGFDVSDDYVRHELDGMEIISPLDSRVKINERGFSFNREKFSYHYLDKARDEGVEIEFGAEVTDLGDNKVEVDGGRDVEAEVIIFAGGSNSDLLRRIDIETMKYPGDLAKAIQADVKNVDVDEDYFHYFLGRDIAPGWKISINPKGGDVFSVGAFVVGYSPKKYFDKFLDGEIFDEAEVINVQRGEDQIITIPNDLVLNNVCFVGGAAGQAGIPFSMKAGEMCGNIVGKAVREEKVGEEFLLNYEKKWKSNFNKYYKLARFSLLNIKKMSDEDLDRAVKSLENTNISEIMDEHDNKLLIGLIIALKMFKNDPGIISLAKYLFK
ncbi:hypothetical protein C9439_06500 [archaeon SCG-AAA382B04]|nr:hypothetical protein C9439_06500 [archaeon SCG-AAA382B04]